MQHLVFLVEDLSLRPVVGRLAKMLLAEADEDGVMRRPHWFTQQELASRLGTVPDVVQRALRKLEMEAITLLDKAALTESAG